MNNPKIEVFPGRKRLRRQWFYRVVAANGETLVISEGFTRHRDAWRAANTLLGAIESGAVQIQDAPA